MTYQGEDPVAFMNSQGWQFKIRGQELVTKCPFCEKEHFSMNRGEGVWQCFRCGAKGNLYQLQKRLGLDSWRDNGRGNGKRDGIQSFGQALGKSQSRKIPMSQADAMHAALLADQEALDYCTKTRHWSLDVIKRLKIGLRKDSRGKWIAYPWLRRGECAGIKYRILPACEQTAGHRFEREKDCESVLFNADALDSHEEVILASGEADALALLTLGFENVVATTTGEGALPAPAVDALAKKSRVFICFDNDEAGCKGAREAGKRIGLDRAYLVRLPDGVKDANEFLIQGKTREDFEKLLASAVRFDVPSIYSLAQALDKLEEEKTIGSWDQPERMTPWSPVNRIIGAWREGNLIVVSGPQGTGKTTFALNIASFWASNEFPALVDCLEMSVEELVQHVLCAHYRKTEEQITPQIINQARNDLANWPLYLGANPRITGTKEVTDLLRQAIRRYGLKLVVFDNLHMLARSIDHRSEEVGVITKSFKLLAMESEIPVVLIAQPRKLKPAEVMTPWDLKDSVDIYSDADQILLLHREMIGKTKDKEAVAAAESDSGENLDPKTLIRVAKSRHMASRNTLLYFEGAEHRFREKERGDLFQEPGERNANLNGN